MYTLGSGFIPSANHAGGLRYHGMSSIVSQLYDDGYVKARSVEQTEVFKAAETFAWISAEVKMMFNDDTSKIAEMMIDGANMGIKSITEKLNRYSEAEKESISLAKKFEKTCEKLIQDMKKYL